MEYPHIAQPSVKTPKKLDLKKDAVKFYKSLLDHWQRQKMKLEPINRVLRIMGREIRSYKVGISEVLYQLEDQFRAFVGLFRKKRDQRILKSLYKKAQRLAV